MKKNKVQSDSSRSLSSIKDIKTENNLIATRNSYSDKKSKQQEYLKLKENESKDINNSILNINKNIKSDSQLLTNKIICKEEINQDLSNSFKTIEENSNSELMQQGLWTNKFILDKKKKLENIKKLRKTMKRSKRKKIIRQYSFLNQISKCNSKIGLFHIFVSLTTDWKRLLKNYMERAFLFHLHIRQIKDFAELMSQRQNIYEAIDFPDILNTRVNFKNNLVKNFCKGFLSFVVIYSEELIENGWMERSHIHSKKRQNKQK